MRLRFVCLLFVVGCDFGPRPHLPSGAHPPSAEQLSILRAAFDSVGRCYGRSMPYPSFYVVDSVDRFAVPAGNGEADGYFQPELYSITVTTTGWLTPTALADTSAQHRVYFAQMFRWVGMHEAMHAHSGILTHPQQLFGKEGPCGVLAWWYDTGQPAPVP